MSISWSSCDSCGTGGWNSIDISWQTRLQTLLHLYSSIGGLKRFLQLHRARLKHCLGQTTSHLPLHSRSALSGLRFVLCWQTFRAFQSCLKMRIVQVPQGSSLKPSCRVPPAIWFFSQLRPTSSGWRPLGLGQKQTCLRLDYFNGNPEGQAEVKVHLEVTRIYCTSRCTTNESVWTCGRRKDVKVPTSSPMRTFHSLCCWRTLCTTQRRVGCRRGGCPESRPLQGAGQFSLDIGPWLRQKRLHKIRKNTRHVFPRTVPNQNEWRPGLRHSLQCPVRRRNWTPLPSQATNKAKCLDVWHL